MFLARKSQIQRSTSTSTSILEVTMPSIYEVDPLHILTKFRTFLWSSSEGITVSAFCIWLQVLGTLRLSHNRYCN